MYDIGKPKEGVWFITDNEKRWIWDKPDMPRIEAEVLREAILKGMDNCDGKYVSRNDIATEIIKLISEKLAGDD